MKALTGTQTLVQMLKPGVYKTTQTVQIDLADCNSCDIAVSIGAITDGAFALSLQEGNAANFSDMANVAAGFFVGATQAQATVANAIYEYGYLGNKRYLQVTITVTGSPATGAGIEVIGVKGDLRHALGA